MAIDPICGMVVDESSPLCVQRDGRTYFFCCESCRRKFLGQAPQTASHSAPQTAAPTAAPTASTTASRAASKTAPAVAYICPMCSGVRSLTPSACPHCGMALEPELPQAGMLDDTAELDDMTRRLLIATPPTLLVLVLAMGPMFGLRLPEFLAGRANGGWQAILAAIVVGGAGWPILSRAVSSVVSGRLNMFTLIGVGTSAAYLLSLATLLSPPTAIQAGRSHAGDSHIDNPHAGDSMAEDHGPPLYFESAAAIMTLVLLGQVLELRARRRTGDAVRALLDLAPPVAHLWSESGETDTPLAQVRPGDRLAVRPGEKVPVDGVLLAGAAAVSEALLTGEPMPVTKAPGDRLLAGSLNQSHAFTMRAEHTGADTLLAKIIQLVVQAQRSRAPIQRVADQVASYFVPAVLAIAVLTFIAWWWRGGEAAAVRGLVHAVSVLVIACPCALGLATPMSVIVGVGRGAREGVLIRDAETLEQLARIDTVVLDKTGTLTAGRPELRDILPLAPIESADLLRLAAAVERWSEHPLGRAIVAAHDAGLSSSSASSSSASSSASSASSSASSASWSASSSASSLSSASVSATAIASATATASATDPKPASRSASPMAAAGARDAGLESCDGRAVAPADFVSVPGGGVAGIVEGRLVRVGSQAFCEAPRLDTFLSASARRPPTAATAPPPPSQLVTISIPSLGAAPILGPRGAASPASIPDTQPWPDGPWRAWSERWRERGCTVLFVAIDGQPAGLLALHDPIKPEAAQAVAALRQRGLRLTMATGDNERTAREVARQISQGNAAQGDVSLGGAAREDTRAAGMFDEVRAGLSPGDKLAVLEACRRSGRRVAMLGDGVNDAPALAAADVGVAMGTGSDVAIESAGVTLVAGDLAAFVRAVDLSRAVMRNIRQNLFFAFVYNGLGIPLAAGALQPVLGLGFGPMTAAVAMSFSSVSVIANALRLARRR